MAEGATRPSEALVRRIFREEFRSMPDPAPKDPEERKRGWFDGRRMHARLAVARRTGLPEERVREITRPPSAFAKDCV
ncbi:MAG TPA: hypothetical protein VF032_19565 [Thermoleophilaceae bacterium]